MELSHAISCALLILGFSAHAEELQPPGQTPKERVAFLSALDDENTRQDLKVLRNQYYLGALSDPSIEVRSYAAYGLRGNSNIPKVIHVITSDPHPLVRQSAAISMSHWVTDNGAETCTGVEPILKHLDQFLLGLRDDASAQYVVEILGGRWSGEKFLPCCMPVEARQRVIAAIEAIRVSPPKHTVASYWSAAIPANALKHISQCAP